MKMMDQRAIDSWTSWRWTRKRQRDQRGLHRWPSTRMRLQKVSWEPRQDVLSVERDARAKAIARGVDLRAQRWQLDSTCDCVVVEAAMMTKMWKDEGSPNRSPTMDP